MNEKINRLIPLAIQAVKDNNISSHGEVKKENKGYISSMGASIIQTGLLATLAFYANDEGKKAHSSNLLKAIYQIITGEQAENKNSLIKLVINTTKKDDVNNNEIGINDLDFDKMYIMEQNISDALVALKLAIRTFKITK